MPAKPKKRRATAANTPATLSDVRDAIVWHDELIDFNQQQTLILLTNILQTLERQTALLQTIADKPVQGVFNVQNEHIEHRKKPSKRLQATVAWIRANDPENKLTVREIAALANVSVGTVHAAKQEIDRE